jgi:hypothetical protein
MQRARNEGFSRGFLEGKVFILAVGEDFKREQVLDWLDNVIEEGREELSLQHASEREVEAWDCPAECVLGRARGATLTAKSLQKYVVRL